MISADSNLVVPRCLLGCESLYRNLSSSSLPNSTYLTGSASGKPHLSLFLMLDLVRVRGWSRRYEPMRCLALGPWSSKSRWCWERNLSIFGKVSLSLPFCPFASCPTLIQQTIISCIDHSSIVLPEHPLFLLEHLLLFLFKCLFWLS